MPAKKGNTPPKAKKKPLPVSTVKKAMLKALEAEMNIVSRACLRCKISRNTHYTWLREDELYAEAVKELDNVVLDFAEGALHSQIAEGVPSSTMFFLKTKGRNRGYIEKAPEVQVDRTIPLVRVVSVRADGTRVER